MDFQKAMISKDLKIAQLERQVAQLKEERDFWKARALTGAECAEASASRSSLIVLSKEKLKGMLLKIQDVKLLSFLGIILQKSLPKGSSSEECKSIAEIVPMPTLPNISLSAEGDINVGGNWNDMHDNENINL